MNLNELFYRDKPLFGLDIGHSSVKVMQLAIEPNKKPRVEGYGKADFPPEAILNGVISNFDKLGKSIFDLFKGGLQGNIYTRRVACTLPTAHTYSRMMKLPHMADADIAEAINLEAEQYIPMPVNKLYIDYEISSRGPDGIDLLMVATPRTIVDSYINLLESLDLEPVALEPSVNATSRLLTLSTSADSGPTIVIDFGQMATDVAVFDKTLIVNSTLAGGGDMINKLISEHLGVDIEAAFEMKNKYGIGVSEHQQQIAEAIAPMLENLIKEVRKVVRYYNERVGQAGRQVSRIATSGGGASMQGIGQYLSKELGLPAATLNPWQDLDFGHLHKPAELDQTALLTVAGQALLNPKDVFHD